MTLIVIIVLCIALGLVVGLSLVAFMRHRHVSLDINLYPLPPEVWRQAGSEQQARAKEAVRRGEAVEKPEDAPVVLALIEHARAFDRRHRTVETVTALLSLISIVILLLFVPGIIRSWVFRAYLVIIALYVVETIVRWLIVWRHSGRIERVRRINEQLVVPRSPDYNSSRE